jgi:hypothetical protein
MADLLVRDLCEQLWSLFALLIKHNAMKMYTGVRYIYTTLHLGTRQRGVIHLMNIWHMKIKGFWIVSVKDKV